MGKMDFFRDDCVVDLPAPICREIGRVMVRWAHLEHAVQLIILNLMQVTLPYGRLAVREPRLEDRIQLLKNLADLRGIEIPSGPLSTLQKNSRDLARDRDTIAHGIWTNRDGHYYVILSRGKWSDENVPHASRSAIPEALKVDVPSLRSITAGIDATTRLAMLLSQLVQQKLTPPPEVHPEQFPRRTRKSGQGPSRPRRQPQASQR